MTGNQQDLRPGEEEAIGSLLREMAPEAGPAPEVRERIRQAVAAEWRASIPQARPAPGPAARRWRKPAMALAAGLAVAAVALGIYQAGAPFPPAVVASLTRLHGPVEAGIDGAWQPVTTGQDLVAGQQLVTGPGGKVALALPGGATLRLDTNTRIALAGIDRVVVERGAVYLDAGHQPAADPDLWIDTKFGRTRHLGTQYEVRVLPTTMQVSVREGLVETALGDGQSPVQAQAGEQLLIGRDGTVARQAVDRRDARWDWVADITPPYAIEDRRLAEFLAWVSRETGRDLAFASPAAEAAAQSIVLRGSVAGLSPDDALAAVMSTTNLGYSTDNGRLVVTSARHRAATR